MIYLDSSVALAHVLSQERYPTDAFWQQPMTSSRLLRYEVWNRLHAYGADADRHGKARAILRRVGYQEMSENVLARALTPFPLVVRTLDGLHLATMDHLRAQGLSTTLASYDLRLLAVAEAMGFQTVQP